MEIGQQSLKDLAKLQAMQLNSAKKTEETKQTNSETKLPTNLNDLVTKFTSGEVKEADFRKQAVSLGMKEDQIKIVKSQSEINKITATINNDKNVSNQAKLAIQKFTENPTLDTFENVVNGYADSGSDQTKETAKNVGAKINQLNESIKNGDAKAVAEALKEFDDEFGGKVPGNIEPPKTENAPSGGGRGKFILKVLGKVAKGDFVGAAAEFIEGYPEYVKSFKDEADETRRKMQESQKAAGGCPPGHNWGPSGCLGNYGQNGTCP